MTICLFLHVSAELAVFQCTVCWSTDCFSNTPLCWRGKKSPRKDVTRSCPHPLRDEKREGLSEKAHEEWQRGRWSAAVRSSCSKVGEADACPGEHRQWLSYDLKHFAGFPLLNPHFFCLRKEKRIQGANAFLSMSQLFWPTHADELEALRTYASVLYKQFKIDFSCAQHYVLLLFPNARRFISCIYFHFARALHSCFWVS